MATVPTERHPGGRPVTVHHLTDFGRALEPVLERLGWSRYVLADKIGEDQKTIWRWMKKAKKWPPSDKVEAVSAAVGVRLTAPHARRRAR